MIFYFHFYELRSAFGHPPRIGRGISASDNPDGRYNTYFHALATEITQYSINNATSAIEALISGESDECELGGDAWVMSINSTSVEFLNENFDEMNNGVDNVFPFSEFKWVFAAWREFLFMPDQAGGTQYEFSLPSTELIDLKDVPKLLKLKT